MADTIIVALISGAITILTVIITNSKTQAILQNEVKHIYDEIDEMKRKLDEHNGYGKKFLEMQGDIKVIQERQKVANNRIDDLEHKN